MDFDFENKTVVATLLSLKKLMKLQATIKTTTITMID